MREEYRAWALVGAIGLMLTFSYLFMLIDEGNVTLILLFSALFLVLILVSVVIKTNKKKR